MAETSKQRRQSWSALLPELLESIAGRLPLFDCLNFSGVCRNWRAAVRGYSNIANFSKSDPWLLVYEINEEKVANDTCYLYDTSDIECCTIRLPHLQGALCLVSRAGWLLASKRDRIFFYDIISATKIDIPPYPGPIFDAETFCTFSSLPSNPDCTIVMMRAMSASQMEVGLWNNAGDAKWETREVGFNNGSKFGQLQEIWCCNCSEDEQCNCDFKNKVSFVDSNALFTYDYETVEKTKASTKAERYSSIKWSPCEILQDMKKLHGTDLLKKFRRDSDGISISLCSFQMKINASSTIAPSVLTIIEEEDDNNKKTNLRIIDGALIKPRLKDKN